MRSSRAGRRRGEQIRIDWVAALRNTAVVALTIGVVVVVAVLWSGYGETHSGEERSLEGDRTGKEHAYIREQERRIRSKLKSSGADFRGSRVRYGIAPIVCGEVNANTKTNAIRFRGRGGFQRFISGGDLQVLEEEMATGEMEKTWARVCR